MTTKYAKDQPSGFTNHIHRIAIVGAGGSVGKPIAEALLQTGKHTITALTRPNSQSKLPSGVQSISVDYNDTSSLATALKEQDCLIITLSVQAPPDTQSKLISAAATAGIKYVMPNVWGCDLMHDPLANSGLTWGQMRSTLTDIEKKGLTWTALICGFWYEHSLLLGSGGFGFDFPGKKLTLNDDGNTKINVSTQVQCGRAVATLLSLKVLPEDEHDEGLTVSRWANKPVYISSFLLSQRDMFESWKRVTGEKERGEGWTVVEEGSKERYERGLKMMRNGDREGFLLAMYSRVFFPNGDGDHEHRVGLDNELLGLPVEDLDEQTLKAKGMLERGWHYFTNRV
ncbi:NAD(P)-binding protein [Aspergillus sclerotiicarbonarius CBS 121057]|uniref:NAD(P)-binding protein n=1 Tax=Aspergillus sclerotiicarbonarius (strain CBS 121057 / IBT 28362) TaxID=1448318 RepID=A0A319EXS1_ASPSB|nr:NAD(P)-binding protein [Aspergillus sclerotiicarbonarius CBS 121057]